MTHHASDSAEALHEAAVIRYLEQHPHLLLQYPNIVANLPGFDDHQRHVSETNQQLARLHQQLDQERQRLLLLIERAREYERLTSQLHRLTVQLIAANDLKQTQQLLEAGLKQEFGSEAVALNYSYFGARDHLAGTVKQIIIKLDHCLCGALTPKQFKELFGQAGASLQSAALIPLTGTHLHGVLAIGSANPNRFTPDMGTDILNRLGAIVSAKLIELMPSHLTE
jgi:hypothetical protein